MSTLHKILAQRVQVQDDCFCIKYQCASYAEARRIKDAFYKLHGEVKLTIGHVAIVLDNDTPVGQQED